MKYQNSKFDKIFGNNISAAIHLLEEQDRQMKKFSIIESGVSRVIRKINKQNAVLEMNKAISSLNSVNAILAAQESWNNKFHSTFSPIWTQMEVFSRFHDQTSQIGKIINPNISDFIHANVRTKYKKSANVSMLEATYLETFEQLEKNIDIETLQDITEEIKHNKEWSEDLNNLGIAFHNSYLSNEFTNAITELVSRRLKAKNPKIIAAVVSILFLLYALWNSMEDELKK